MGSLVVLLLLGLWASILLPGLVRARREATPISSVSTFERCMSMLAPTAGRLTAGRVSRVRGAAPHPGRHVLVLRDAAAVATGRRRQRVLRRRRALLLRLLAATVATAAAAVVVGGWAWSVFAVVAASLVTYVGLLVQLREREAEVRRKVRRLPSGARRRPAPPRPAASDTEVPLAAAAGHESSTVLVRRWQG